TATTQYARPGRNPASLPISGLRTPALPVLEQKLASQQTAGIVLHALQRTLHRLGQGRGRAVARRRRAQIERFGAAVPLTRFALHALVQCAAGTTCFGLLFARLFGIRPALVAGFAAG